MARILPALLVGAAVCAAAVVAALLLRRRAVMDAPPDLQLDIVPAP